VFGILPVAEAVFFFYAVAEGVSICVCSTAKRAHQSFVDLGIFTHVWPREQNLKETKDDLMDGLLLTNVNLAENKYVGPEDNKENSREL